MPEERQHAGTSTRDVGKRWAPHFVHQFTLVSDFFLEQYHHFGMLPGHAMFIIHLLSYKWDERPVYPSMQTIKDRMNMSYGQIRKYADELESLGCLRCERRKGKTCVFHLEPLFEKLEMRRNELEAAHLARWRKQRGYGRG